MSYKGKTSFFGIPVAGKGQKISSKEEKRKANIIENQLLASQRGVKCCVFEDGEYNAIQHGDGTYTIILSAVGFNKALEGIVNGGYVKSNSSVKWIGLEKGKIYYLYIKYTDKLYENPEAFITKALPKKKDSSVSSFLFLAVVNLTKGKPRINSNPDGKVYAQDIEGHVNDYTNPHGNSLYQENITVMKELRFEKGSGKDKKTISVLNENNIDDFIIKTTVIDAYSGGKNGVSIVIDNAEEILSAHVVQLKDNIESRYVGDVLIGLSGTDGKVTSKNQVIIYNENDNQGISIRVTIIYK